MILFLHLYIVIYYVVSSCMSWKGKKTVEEWDKEDYFISVGFVMC